MTHAPIIAWSPATGHRLATDKEVASFAFATDGVFRYHDGRVIRRLSCSDPLDMRAIWYFAAVALRVNSADALHADLEYVNRLWTFRICEPFRYRDLLTFADATFNYYDATEALCAAVWGPK